MSKLWDGEPETDSAPGELKSADSAKLFLERHRKQLRSLAESTAREIERSNTLKSK